MEPIWKRSQTPPLKVPERAGTSKIPSHGRTVLNRPWSHLVEPRVTRKKPWNQNKTRKGKVVASSIGIYVDETHIWDSVEWYGCLWFLQRFYFGQTLEPIHAEAATDLGAVTSSSDPGSNLRLRIWQSGKKSEKCGEGSKVLVKNGIFHVYIYIYCYQKWMCVYIYTVKCVYINNMYVYIYILLPKMNVCIYIYCKMCVYK